MQQTNTVFSIRRSIALCAIVVLVSLLGNGLLSAATKTWNGSSSTAWNTAANWTPSGVPANGDSVVIGNAVLTNFPVLAATDTIQALTLLGRSGTTSTRAGSVSINTGVTLRITGSVTMTGSTGGTAGSTLGFVASGTGSVFIGGNLTTTNSTGGPPDDAELTFATGSLTVNGNVSLGTLTTTTLGSATVTLGAASAQSLTLGTPASQTFGNLTINSGTTTLGSAIVVGGNLTINSGAGLTTSNNALTLSGNFSKSGTFTGGSSSITLSGTNAQALAAFSTTGALTISKTSNTATFNGNSAAGSMTFSASGATVSVSDGITLAITNALTVNNAANSAVAVTVSGAGRLTAGSIAIGNATALTSNNNTSTTTLTSTIDTLSVSGNVTLNGYFTATNRVNNPLVRLQSGTVNIGGTVTTSNANAANSDSFTVASGPGSAYLTLSGATPFSLSGTGTSNVNLNGTSSTVEYSGAGQAMLVTAYRNLKLSGSGTKTGNVATVNGSYTQTAATWAPGAAVTVGGAFSLSGGTFTAGSLTHNVAGDFSFSGGTLTSTGSTFNFNGTNAQSVTGGSFNNLTLNNTRGLTLTNDATVGGILTFTAGNIRTGSNTLIANGTVSGATSAKLVIGKLRKPVSAGSSVTRSFEIGDSLKLTQPSVTFATVTGAGTLTASTSGSDHANIGTSNLLSSKSVNRTWTLTNSGTTFDNYNATFNWVAADTDAGAATSAYKVGKYDSGTWTYPSTSGNTSTSITASGMTSFSDFAVAQVNSHTITATAGSNGSISPSGSVSVNDGANQSFTITPNSHYHIDSVIVDGVNQGTSGSYTFNSVVADHTIRAVFAIDTYTINATAGANGSISPNGNTTVNYNASQGYTITANSHYHIDSVIVDGVNQGTSGSFTFKNVAANHTIRAVFAIDTYTINASAGANGSISPNGATVVNYDGSQGYTITPDAHYHIDSVVIDGVNAGTSGSQSFNSVSANHTIAAYFGIDQNTITATAQANGSISPNGAVAVNYDASQSFTITADAHYHIDSVVVDGANVGTGGSYTFNNVVAAHTIDAYFGIDQNTITATAHANGSISPNGAVSVNYDANRSFTITPDAHYHIDSVVVDGSNAGTAGSYTFNNVVAAHTIDAYFGIDQNTITASANGSGSISPNGAVTVNYDGSQSFTITPDPHYHIDSVLVDGVDAGTGSSYTFNNVVTSHTISAYFSIDKFTVATSAGANGSISPSGAISVNYGDDASFTISADADFKIVSVHADTADQGAVSSYTFHNVTENHTISASFDHILDTIYASAASHGAISPAGTVSVNRGSNQSFTITPDAHYHIDSVVVDGANVGTGASHTFNDVRATHTIAAYFGVDQNSITATAHANGSISPNGTVSVNYDANQSFTITPDAHYHIDSVMVDGSNVGTGGSYTFNNVVASHTIDAYFAIDTYTITAAAEAHGSISPNGATTMNYDGSQSYTISPDANYHIDSVLVDGVNQGAVASHTFSNVSANHTIHAYFGITVFTINASAGANGSISPNGAVPVNSGADQSFTITPDANFQIVNVHVDTLDLGAVSSHTFTNVTENHTISATFSNIVDTIWASAGPNGSISPSGTVTVNRGSDKTFTINANVNYLIDSVLVDGSPVSAAPTTVPKGPGAGSSDKSVASSVGDSRNYTFNSVSGNHTIHAVFKIKKWDISASAGAGGSITPSGSVSVDAGSNQHFSISASTGFHISDVLVDGSSVGADTAYDFTNVTANHTIAASFAADTFTITASAGSGGSISPSGSVLVAFDSSKTFTITPDLNHSIVNVHVDASDLGAVSSYTFSNVSANHTISVTFKPDTFTVTASAGTGGTVAPSGATRVQAGDSLVITVTPGAAYTIDHLTVNGSTVPAAASYTFHNILGDSTLDASFLKKPYNESITTGNWGSGSTWSFGTVPTTADSAVIRQQDTVTLASGSPSVGALAVNGKLVFSGANRALTITTSGARSGNVMVANTGSVDFQFVTNQRMVVFGNFANAGTLTNLSFGNGSQITMQGTGVHTFASSDSVGVLRLNASSLQLKLTAPLTISTNVILTTGKLYLGANNLTLDTVTANIDTGSVSSYVVTDSTGRIIRRVAAGFTNFPVGTVGSFNPVKVKTGLGSDIFSVGIHAGVQPVSTNDAAGLNKTWSIDRLNGGFIDSTTMTWSWTAADEGAQFTRASAVAWRNDGGPWIEDGFITSLDSSAGRYTATVFGITDFSNFILGNPGALPVQLAEFSGSAVAAHTVQLEWNTVSEEHSYGFYVERRGEKTTIWERISDLVPGAGTTLERQKYSYTDANASAQVYYYRLKFVDLSGTITRSQEIKVSTVLSAEDREPLVFKLNQNYPNPFNPTTTIKYSIANSAPVSLVVYNMLGQEVARLVDGFQTAGRYSVEWNASSLASGSYFYRLISGTNMQVKRLLLVK